MDRDCRPQTVIITGASRGIGAAVARLAARRGYAVCVNYKESTHAAHALVDEIRAGGGKAVAICADVSREGDVVQMFEKVDNELGPITALVNNAGVVKPQSRVEHMTAARLASPRSSPRISVAFFCAPEKPSGACRATTEDEEEPLSTFRPQPHAWVQLASTSTTPQAKALSTR